MISINSEKNRYHYRITSQIIKQIGKIGKNFWVQTTPNKIHFKIKLYNVAKQSMKEGEK